MTTAAHSPAPSGAITAAMVQVASPDDEPVAERRERVAAQVRAISEDADLIVLPELWTVGYAHFDGYAECAESLDGPTVTAFAPIAAERRCHVHLGSIVEATAAGTLRNTAVLLDPRGRIIHRYSKIHVFGYESLETRLLEPGDAVAAAQTPFGTVSATTCYDLRFPGLWTRITDAGARIVTVPAAWPAARRDHWRLLTAARALDNQVFVIAVNATGTHGGVEFGGHSRVVDPWGRTVAEAGTDEGVTLARFDPGAADAIRAEFPVLGDRLDDYGGLRAE